MKTTEYLLTTDAIRERSKKLFDLNVEGKGHFIYHPEKWDEVTEFVYQVILENYPDLNIPFHSRLGHFRPGKIERINWPELELNKLNNEEKVKLLIDLIIPSVLLDAGAGDTWKFKEAKTNLEFNRSEGLGVASFHMFLNKKFSSKNLHQTDADGLLNLTKEILENDFQVSTTNPLVGVEGRLYLLQSLGKVMKNNPSIFKNQRPSDLFDLMKDGNKVDASKVLSSLLKYLGGIWPSRLKIDGIDLGDCWYHEALGPKDSTDSLIPFHKLSQWLSYSLLDAAIVAGFEVINVEKLTGLPEYRNGGLFLDLGLIVARDKNNLTKGVEAHEAFTVEWRAITIVLLDELGARIQKKLHKSPKDFPLAKVLEGGSWWAGRKIAKMKRPDSSPPLKIISDGTVF
jgi:hypothetical protein